jgi:hypothetical protein
VRGVAASVCAAALTLAAALPGPVHAQAALPQAVSDPHGRFAMSFPTDWEVATKTEGMVALVGAGPPAGGHRPTVNVVVEPLPNPMPPDAYAAAAERLAQAAFHNYTVIQEASAAIGGRPAYYRYFTWETNTGATLYQLQVFVTEGKTGFVVTGTTLDTRDRILNDMPLVTQIIETFRLETASN